MIETSRPTTGSAQKQAALWGRAAAEWSERTEPLMAGLFEEVLEQLAVGPGVELLDVGCGSGVAAAIATERGAKVTGLDATPELLEFARRRVPKATFHQGEMEQLPYPDDSFDVVTGFNAFQYAASPVNALSEARRVTRPGGSVTIVTWGRPEKVDMRPVMQGVGSLLPTPLPGTPGPFALSEEGALATLARQAGLQPRFNGSYVDHWDFANEEQALRALTSAGVMTPAIEQVGEDRVRKTVAAAIEPYRTADGSYHLQNEFVYLVARA